MAAGSSIGKPACPGRHYPCIVVSVHPTVLIVEDDDANREVLRLVLELAGYQVTTAGTGEEALERAATDRPDTVLLDLGLPDQPGEDISAALRARLDPAARIIITSGQSLGAADRVRLGADAVLQKPFNPDRLLAALR